MVAGVSDSVHRSDGGGRAEPCRCGGQGSQEGGLQHWPLVAAGSAAGHQVVSRRHMCGRISYVFLLRYFVSQFCVLVCSGAAFAFNSFAAGGPPPLRGGGPPFHQEFCTVMRQQS